MTLKLSTSVEDVTAHIRAELCQPRCNGSKKDHMTLTFEYDLENQ